MTINAIAIKMVIIGNVGEGLIAATKIENYNLKYAEDGILTWEYIDYREITRVVCDVSAGGEWRIFQLSDDKLRFFP
jgi:hypothetical protein